MTPPPPRRRRGLPKWLARVAAIASLSVASCGVSSLDVLNVTVRADGVEVVRDVAYGEAARQRMDVYRTPERTGAPVVVFIHGGAWRTGSRAEYRFMGLALARMGFIGVVADYRHFPEVAFPGFVHDAARATAAAKAGAAAWGGDPRRVVLLGHSAGAHIAAMVALDPQYLAGVGLQRDQLAGWVGLAGPYDFLPMRDEDVREVFAAAVDRPESQPVSYADGKAAPARLLHGADDTTVFPSNSISLEARIRAAGGMATAVIYPGMGHAGIITAFTPLFARSNGMVGDVAGFIRALPPSGS